MGNKIPKFITDFRKLHVIQHSMVTMIEIWRKVLQKKKLRSFAGKAAYGFSKNVLILMCSYLKNRKQRVQIDNNFVATKTVIAGIPQGSTDGPLSFGLFINDLVHFLAEGC